MTTKQKEKMRREKARAAKRAKTERMIARAEKKRRWKRNIAVARFFVKSTAATVMVGVTLCGLYLFACACLKVTNMVGQGWRVARAEVAAFVEPAEADDRPDLKSVEVIEPKLSGISFAPDYQTAAPMETHNPDHMDELVDHYAGIYEVDAGTLRGIIMQESTWKPEAYNPDGGGIGAHGLGQLRRQALEYCGITADEAKRDPAAAIRCTAAWTSEKKKEQNGDEAEAVQSYHCGPKCVNKRKGIKYLQQVVKNYDTRPKGVKRVG